MRPLVILSSNSFGILVRDGVSLIETVADVERVDTLTVAEDAFLELLGRATAIVGAPRRFSADISSCKTLKTIAIRGAGTDSLNVQEATENGILVTFVPAANATSVAELTIGLLLAVTRRIHDAAASVRNGEWERLAFAGREVAGKTVGIVGLGAIGRKVARMLEGFGVTKLGFDPYVDPTQVRELNVDIVSLETLLSASDFICIHCPATSDTKGLIGAEALSIMKSTAYLVNTSRGEVVDQKALAQALRGGRLAGYATDVLEVEPPQAGEEFLSIDNVICTPHIGGYTVEAARRVDMMVASDVVAVLEGRVPEMSRVLNPSLLTPQNLHEGK